LPTPKGDRAPTAIVRAGESPHPVRRLVELPRALCPCEERKLENPVRTPPLVAGAHSPGLVLGVVAAVVLLTCSAHSSSNRSPVPGTAVLSRPGSPSGESPPDPHVSAPAAGGVGSASLAPASPPVWQPTSTPKSFPGLFYPSMAEDPADGEAVLFGGCSSVLCSGSAVSNATWTYSEGIWSKLALGVSPPARYEAQMAWDPAAGAVVLFGGSGCSNPPTCSALADLNDTWTFANNTWTEQFPRASPASAIEGAMAFDPSYPGVLLFGQFNYCPFECGTWVYAAGDWAFLNESVEPAQRYDDMMATDGPDDGALLFGGDSQSGAVLADTWLFTDGSWKQLSPLTSPAPRSTGAMSVDPTTGRPMLYGGEDLTLSNFPGVTYSDTWTFEGNTWESLPTSTSSPGELWQGAMALDPSSNVAVLIGGCGNTGCPNSESWAFGVGNPIGFASNDSTCSNVTVGSLTRATAGAPTSLLNGSYSLAAHGCASETVVSVAVSGDLRIRGNYSNATEGWSGSLLALGPGTVYVNVSAPPTQGGSKGSGVGALGAVGPYLPYLAAAAVAVAALAAVLVLRRRRRPPSDPEIVDGVAEAPASSGPS
jgi:hypothetical protein